MEQLCIDVIGTIASFCSIPDIKNASQVNREWNKIFSNNEVWIDLGQRDHPLLHITNKYTYNTSHPMVTDLQTNDWAKKWLKTHIINRNGKKDEMVASYVHSIMTTMLQVERLTSLFDKHKDTQPIDWRISINIKIDELLSYSEEEEKDMYRHIKFLKKKSI